MRKRRAQKGWAGEAGEDGEGLMAALEAIARSPGMLLKEAGSAGALERWRAVSHEYRPE